MKRYKLIIFDVDGTLIDAYKAIEESLNYTLETLGYLPKDSSSIRRAIGWGDENFLKPFFKKGDLDKALKIYREHHQDSLLKSSRLLLGTRKVLTSLNRKGYKLAVASNRPTKFTKILIRHLDIDKYFDLVLCADRLKDIKPNPKILLGIMQRLRVSPQETLYVGDMAIDVQAGRNAGCDTVAVPTGSSSKSELRRAKPLKIIPEISHLLSLL